LGYDEIDFAADGSPEHRLQFSNGIGMAIVFRHFRFDGAEQTTSK